MTKKRKYTYDWPRPMVSVDAAVFAFFGKRAKLLLIQRGREPFKGKWALPGGYVGIDEELGDAVTRELEEETGLRGIKLKQIHTFGKCGRDPRGRQITIVYLGIAGRGQTKAKAGDDAAKTRWFDVDKMPRGLAFDHDAVTKFAIARLKHKSMYRSKMRK
jgi:8-oxo-dGTP diphosphatase